MLKLGKKKGGGEVPAVVEGEPGAEGEAAPKKKKLPLLFIIIPAALVVLGGGGAGAFFLLQPKPAADEAHGEEKGDHGKEKKDDKKDAKGGGHGKGGGGEADPSLGKVTEGPDGITFLTLPDLVVNVQAADGRPTHLKLKLTLEMSDSHQAEVLQGQMPRLQDMLQSFLRELRPEELQGSAASFQLRAELARRVNLILAPGKIDAVLIEEMLVN
ncbi:flagellar basal body-associated FliL family protein [Brevundimonas sp.]|uniref:flagellar basal body-associated FliL family protein n=1 Tax=Brevundimonas sp. TaxID=1871086 RepID=UPI0026381264|nr:flagellar basal body-associated FliL family protein [Brevundimonas sp.]